MERKKFLTGLATAAFSIPALAMEMGPKKRSDEESNRKQPAYLIPGDTVGITAPAGHISLEGISSAKQKLEEWGFKVAVGKTTGTQDFTFAASDEERRKDFQDMLDDKNIKTILCARGGYGAVRIIDDLDFSTFKKHPKWIIGFSDITVLHCYINGHLDIASIHSKMCNSFPDDWNTADDVQKATINSIRDCLIGTKMEYQTVASVMNVPGSAEGILVGGNLRTIENMAATKSEICTKNKILFLEDTGEYLYSIDRMLWNLERSGKLKTLNGLIIGGFKIKAEEGNDPFGETLEEIVLKKVRKYNYPVCFNFPVGHQKNNFSLKCGIKHRLTVASSETILSEIN